MNLAYIDAVRDATAGFYVEHWSPDGRRCTTGGLVLSLAEARKAAVFYANQVPEGTGRRAVEVRAGRTVATYMRPGDTLVMPDGSKIVVHQRNPLRDSNNPLVRREARGRERAKETADTAHELRMGRKPKPSRYRTITTETAARTTGTDPRAVLAAVKALRSR